MCVVRRMIGGQVYSVVRWLFGCGLVGLLVALIVPLFLSFLAMPDLCCFLRVTRLMINRRGARIHCHTLRKYVQTFISIVKLLFIT